MGKAKTKPKPVHQANARQLWRWLMGTPWPRGWVVEWGGAKRRGDFLRKSEAGRTSYQAKRIWLDYEHAIAKPSDFLDSILHEYLHLAVIELPHNKQFLRLLNELRVKCLLPRKRSI